MHQRYLGYPAEGGIFVLDTQTGAVVWVVRPGPTPAVSGMAIVDVAIATAEVPSAPTPASSHDDLDVEVIGQFPTPIAQIWKALVTADDPFRACVLLSDAFTVVVKWLAFLAVCEMLRLPDVRDPTVAQLLRRDLQRPLVSTWSLLFGAAVQALADSKQELVVGELVRTYDVLEKRCREKFTEHDMYEDEHGVERRRARELGLLTAMVRFRNKVHHAFNLSPDASRRLLDAYMPVMRTILRHTRFLTRYPVMALQGQGEGLVGRPLVGLSTRPMTPVERPTGAANSGKQHSVELWDEGRNLTLPLSPFIRVQDARVDMLEACVSKTLVYVALDGEPRPQAQAWPAWQKMVTSRLETDVMAVSDLSMDKLLAAANTVTNDTLRSLCACGAYIPEVSVPRPELDEELRRFEEGRLGAFAVGGENGSGKTTFLAQQVERWRARGDVVLFYRGSLLTGGDLARGILRDLRVSAKHMDEFLDNCSSCLPAGRHVWLVIDGLHEHPQPADVIPQLEAIVGQASHEAWFRVVVSVTDSAHRRLPTHARLGARHAARYYQRERDDGGSALLMPLRQLSTTSIEAMYDAYRAYRHVDPADPAAAGIARFCPTTEFSALSTRGFTRQLLRQPLMARLVMETFHQRELPSDLRSDDAMRLYMDRIVQRSRESDALERERGNLLRRLVGSMDRASTDVVKRDDILSVIGKHDREYEALLDIGVLAEHWSNDECLVRFAFERLFEYLLAEHHAACVDSSNDLLDLVRRAVHFPALRGSLTTLLMRACEAGHMDVFADVVDGSETLATPAARSLVREVSSSILVRLASERSLALDELLQRVLKAPSSADATVLCHALDALMEPGVSGVHAAVVAMLAALEHLGITLNAPRWRGEALLRRAQFEHNATGSTAKALLQEALACVRQEGGSPTEALVLRRLGVCLRVEGKLEEAEQHFTTAMNISEALGDVQSCVETQNALATIASLREDREGAEAALRVALRYAREINFLPGIAKILSNLGRLATRGGQLDTAQQLGEEALGMRRDLGDPRGVGSTLVMLADLALRTGNLDGAERHLKEAWAVSSTLGDPRALGETASQLAGLYMAREDWLQAETYARKSLEHWRRSEQPRHVAHSLHLLAALVPETELPELVASMSALPCATPVERLWARELDLLEAARTAETTSLSMAIDAFEAALRACQPAPAADDGPRRVLRRARSMLTSRGQDVPQVMLQRLS